MAAGDVTLVDTAGNKPSAPTFVDAVDVEGPASYATGGHVLGLAALIGEGKTILGAVVLPEGANANAEAGEYDEGNDKLIIRSLAGVEVTAATDLTGQVLRLLVFSH
jgi:hypothetical protein